MAPYFGQSFIKKCENYIRKLRQRHLVRASRTCCLNKVIDKIDTKERGIKVQYFLTNKGKQHFKLLIKVYGKKSKGTSNEETKRRMGLYLLIVLFSKSPAYTFKSRRICCSFVKEQFIRKGFDTAN